MRRRCPPDPKLPTHKHARSLSCSFGPPMLEAVTSVVCVCVCLCVCVYVSYLARVREVVSEEAASILPVKGPHITPLTALQRPKVANLHTKQVARLGGRALRVLDADGATQVVAHAQVHVLDVVGGVTVLDLAACGQRSAQAVGEGSQPIQFGSSAFALSISFAGLQALK